MGVTIVDVVIHTYVDIYPILCMYDLQLQVGGSNGRKVISIHLKRCAFIC